VTGDDRVDVLLERRTMSKISPLHAPDPLASQNPPAWARTITVFAPRRRGQP
jgi:hypothetical protein